MARESFSIRQVKEEIDDLSDRLTEWASDRAPKSFFKKTDDRKVLGWYGKIMEWVQDQLQFKDAAKAEFASGADGWLVAYSKSNGFVLVTHEDHRPESKKSVKIPNVCDEFGVEYTNTFAMLRDLGVQLVKGRPKK